MASIKISDLRPSGLDLFGDSESFLDDLSDNDLATITGASWRDFWKGFCDGLTAV
jgi:hypothetical protein